MGWLNKKMRQILPVMILLLAFPIFGWSQQKSADEIEIRILPQAEVYGESFTLGEISEIDGFDFEALERLANIKVGVSPLPGRSLVVSESMLRSRLGGWDGTSLKLIVPDEANVVRPGQIVTGDEIGKLVLEKAREDASIKDSAELKQQLVNRVRDAVLPKGKVNWKMVLMGRHIVGGGNRVYQVSANMNGKKVWETMVRVRQKIFEEVVVARESIRRNQTISKNSLTLERKNLSANRGAPYITSLGQVIGKKAKRPIGIGEALRQDVITAPADVTEGGRVFVVYETSSLVVRTPGVALVKGKVGDFIPVRNLGTGRIIHGILGPDGTVKVN